MRMKRRRRNENGEDKCSANMTEQESLFSQRGSGKGSFWKGSTYTKKEERRPLVEKQLL